MSNNVKRRRKDIR